MDPAASRSKVLTPFGTWEMDKETTDLVPKLYLLYSTLLQLLIYKDVYFVKIIQNGLRGDEELQPYRVVGLQKEIQMMLLAGADCSIQPIGRVYGKGSLRGIIMPLAAAIADPQPPYLTDAPKLDLPPLRQLIGELTKLVTRLHAKGIIHGDIKPHNLLLTRESPSRLVFCDFGSAVLESKGEPPGSATCHYLSPFRSVMDNVKVPLAKADDLYMTGITIWQLYTGCEPFEGVDHDYIEDVIASGFQPSVLKVDDEDIRQLVVSHLEAGNPPLLEGQTYGGNEVCVHADVVFTDCVAVPPHTYEKVVHHKGCLASGQKEGCNTRYRVPEVLPVSSVDRVKCSVCPAIPT